MINDFGGSMIIIFVLLHSATLHGEAGRIGQNTRYQGTEQHA